MTGIQCTGRYCDNLRLTCTTMSGLSKNNCTWSGWTSEEWGQMTFPPGYYAVGAQCSGSYYDNVRFWICHP